MRNEPRQPDYRLRFLRPLNTPSIRATGQTIAQAIVNQTGCEKIDRWPNHRSNGSVRPARSPIDDAIITNSRRSPVQPPVSSQTKRQTRLIRFVVDMVLSVKVGRILALEP
jgi:hypothetical protein